LQQPLILLSIIIGIMTRHQEQQQQRKKYLEDRIVALQKQREETISDRKRMNIYMGCDTTEEEEASESY
jgi:hypothetical protein